MNCADDGMKIEFVCSRCLFAVESLDTGPWPRCPRGHGRMEADDLDLLPTARLSPGQRRVVAARGSFKKRVDAA